MILNKIPVLNLRYALGEIALIFIGVTAAFLFDQFNEERSLMAKEYAVLSEIVEDLKATSSDLASDIAYSHQLMAARVNLMRAVQSNDPTEVDMVNISAIFGDPILYPKISGYRALESAGLNLVSDQLVRASLTDFYDLRLTRVRDREEWVSRENRRLEDLLMKYLDVRWTVNSNSSARVGPRDVRIEAIALRDAQALLAEPELNSLLLFVDHASRLTLDTYDETRLEIESLINSLELHLEAIRL